jgi:hypothetical protein
MTPEELEMILIGEKMTDEYRKYLTSTTIEQRRSDLAKIALKTKWRRDSDAILGAACPFCKDTFIRQRDFDSWSIIFDCKICICPKQYCATGTVLVLDPAENECTVSKLSEKSYNNVVTALKSMIID